MRIGIDSRQLAIQARTGVENYLYYLVESLRMIDANNEYYLFVDRQDFNTVKESHNVNVVYVKDLAPLRIVDTWEIVSLPVALKKHKINVFYSPHTKFPPLKGVGKIVTIHDLAWLFSGEGYTWSNIKKRRIWFDLAARYAHRIIAVSKNTKRDILMKYPKARGKIRVVLEGVNERFRVIDDQELLQNVLTKYGIRSKYILSIGATHYKRKNLDGLLRAYRHLWKNKGIRHCLVVVGENGQDAERIPEILRDETTNQNVILTGYVSQDNLVLLLNGADVLVYPSFYEGFGLPVLEAMACGVPVVASSTSSLPEVVGNAGILVDPYCHTSIADGIYQVLSDAKLRNSLTKKGLLRATHFTWKQMAEEILEEIVGVAREIRQNEQ